MLADAGSMVKPSLRRGAVSRQYAFVPRSTQNATLKAVSSGSRLRSNSFACSKSNAPGAGGITAGEDVHAPVARRRGSCLASGASQRMEETASPERRRALWRILTIGILSFHPEYVTGGGLIGDGVARTPRIQKEPLQLGYHVGSLSGRDGGT